MQGYRFIITPQSTKAVQKTYQVSITVSTNYRVVVDLLDYNPDTGEEVFMVYDGRKGNLQPDTFRWKVEDDLVEFPVQSTSTAVTLSWQVKGSTSSGRLALVVRSSKFLIL